MKTITLFENCVSKQCREVTWQEVYETVRGDMLHTRTEAYRKFLAASDKRATKNMKSLSFPALMPCCHCEDGVRQLKRITGYTGYCQVDFDHLSPEQLSLVWQNLKQVPEVLLMHRSMSGLGLHVYFPYTGGDYKKAFRQGNDYMARMAGAEYDASLAPAVHLSCLCHDAEAYFNPGAKAFSVAEEPLRQKPQRASSHRSTGTAGKQAAKTTKMERVAEFLSRQPLRYDVLSRKMQIRSKDEGQMSKDERQMSKDESLRSKDEGQMSKDESLRSKDEGQMANAKWTDLSDRRTNELLHDCNRALGTDISKATFMPMLLSSRIPEVNPLREYILSLPPWDGQTDYIAQVAGMVRTHPNPPCEGGDLWHQCFRKWFVAMVAGWMKDEVVNHQVLVLIGEQGIFKTTWLDALMPPELAQYRSKQSGTRYLDKDEQLRATEFGLINMDEIDRMTEAELNALKSLITATDVNVRSPYAYGKERRLRVASYVASGNKEQFLTDQTGNRRWLPFHVERIESPFEHPLPYEGLYAQAWHLVQEGFNYWFDLREIRQLAGHVEAFAVETNEQQLLPVYFEPCPAGTPGAQLLTVAEISAKLTTYGNIRRPMDVRQLGALLRKMGYEAKRMGHNRYRGYIVLEKTAESINATRRINASTE